jgi:hypothetical protein
MDAFCREYYLEYERRIGFKVEDKVATRRQSDLMAF